MYFIHLYVRFDELTGEHDQRYFWFIVHAPGLKFIVVCFRPLGAIFAKKSCLIPDMAIVFWYGNVSTFCIGNPGVFDQPFLIPSFVFPIGTIWFHNAILDVILENHTQCCRHEPDLYI